MQWLGRPPFGSEIRREMVMKVNADTEAEVERQHAVFNGHKLSWLQAGDPRAPLALMLHGIPASAELWREVMPQVAACGWHCVAMDLPGYGATRMAPEADYSIAGAASLLVDWLVYRDYREVWLIGHDIGGGVAQLMLTMAPDRFSKATLSNCVTAQTWPVPLMKVLIGMAQLRMYARTAALRLFPNPIAGQMLKSAVRDPKTLTAERVRRIFWDGKVTEPSGRRKFERMLRALDPAQTLANMAALRLVQVPVHLLWGDADPHQPWSGPGKILAETLPNVKVTRIEGAGHFLQIDDPAAYCEALLGVRVG